MGLLSLFWNLLRSLTFKNPVPGLVLSPVRARRFIRHRRRRPPVGIILLTVTLACSTAASASAGEEAHTMIVAAGFGYQIGDVSMITVKTYDPVTGDVLSDETYELNVNEEGAADSPVPSERIFAGGVGAGATGLSNFTIRVYEASSGKFLWEGNLNLTPQGGADESGHRQPVVDRGTRQAIVTRAANQDHEASRPYFLLRAVDPETGGLVWEDQFSTDGAFARWERIGYRIFGRDEPAARVPHEFDFRIRMWDREGRRLLWEDRLTGIVPGEEDPAEVEEHAQFLAPWPGRDRVSPVESIRYRGNERLTESTKGPRAKDRCL